MPLRIEDEIKQKLSRFFTKNALRKLQSVLRNLPFEPFDVGVFYTLDAELALTIPPSNFPVEIRESSIDELDAIGRCYQNPELFSRRFKIGDRCVAAWEDGEVVGLFWYSLRHDYLEERYAFPIEIPEDTVYAFDIYVSDVFRKRGVLNQFYRSIENWMLANGRKRLRVIIEFDNVISWRAHLSKGFYPTFRAVCIKCFGKNFNWVFPVKREYLPPLVKSFMRSLA